MAIMETMTASLRVPDPPPCLHRNPPATPSSFFGRRRRLLAAVVTAFGFLAVAAATANAWLLLHWDKPVQRFVEANRNEVFDVIFLTASRFGSTIVVLSLGALIALLTWTRCKAVTLAVVVATLARPGIEYFFKELVGRDRPDFQRLVEGSGPSFPSGHPMAAIALWGILPVVVGLFTRRRALWWATVALSVGMIVAIAASRVYLGVHWTSDVVAGILLGAMYLLGVDWVMQRAHALGGCGAAASPPPAVVPRSRAR